MNWKIIVPAALLAAVLLIAVEAAGPVRRTTFRLAPAGGADRECALIAELRAVDGVLGLRLVSAAGELVIDHGPEIEPRQLAQVLAAGGHEVKLLGSRPILPIHALTFPAGHSTGCRRLTQCPAGDAWRELLGRWR